MQGEKGMPREIVRAFTVNRTDTGEQFLQAPEGRPRHLVTYPHLRMDIMAGAAEEHRLGGVLQTLSNRVQGNLISDRRLNDHCSIRPDILYIVGYDVDEKLA